ncbi:hypothetical protein TNIN_358301 [Trichonephila inaurata madagascariensis]|uniref:Uncharacterized protein n=1 Tax=Trichonephila inaurata madagascariensis TaxID=2747483 RepID=A0A8X6YHM3_9ARAC|nr:hypothetical protein TNIN_358301 [Trichonephila inaurata madagascariensis]
MHWIAELEALQRKFQVDESNKNSERDWFGYGGVTYKFRFGWYVAAIPEETSILPVKKLYGAMLIGKC